MITTLPATEFAAVEITSATHPRILLRPMYYEMGFSPSPKIYAREAVVQRLYAALQSLPHQYGLLIWDVYRPRAVQAVLFDWMRGEIRKHSPHFTDEENYQAASHFAAPPSKVGEDYCAPHLSGGAIDLTLCELATSQPCDMGTPFDDCTERAHRDYFTRQLHLSGDDKEIKQRRDLLQQAMEAAGFVSYEYEWWHFGIGDRIWARVTGQPELFGPLFGDEEWPV